MVNSPNEVKLGQSRVQRLGNVVVRLILRSPLHRILSGKLLIITVIGRKTGRIYQNPVAYVRHEDHLLIGTSAGWRRNLRVGEPVRIRLRGANLDAEWEVVTAEGPAAEFYRVILEHNPTHGKFAGIALEPDGSVNREDLRRALARGTAVVRLRPV